MMREEVLYTALISHLNTHPGHTLYGLFDGVKYPTLWSDLEESVLAYDMLFHEERLRADLQSVAPYFVALDFEDKIAKEQSLALLECYGKNGSLFLSSRFDIDKTLEQMRELFYIYTHSGEKGYMRFYEPKIFRRYIAQKNDTIRYALFNHVTCYWCEDTQDPSIVHQYLKKGAFTYEERSISLKPKEPKADV